MPKNMFGYPLKLILGFSGIFCIFGIKQKYPYIIIYTTTKGVPVHQVISLDFE
jgi:hypothetical protein